MERNTIRHQKQIGLARLWVIIIVFALFGASAVFFSACSQTGTIARSGPDLTRPITRDDWMYVQNLGERIRVGDLLFGYPTALENFVRVLTVGETGEETVESWIDRDVKANYFLSLYEGDVFKKAFWVTRISDTDFDASPHDHDYSEYLLAKAHLEEVCGSEGISITYTEILMIPGATYVIVAHTSDGIRAEIFDPVLSLFINGESLYETGRGRIMNEQELIQLFKALN